MATKANWPRIVRRRIDDGATVDEAIRMAGSRPNAMQRPSKAWDWRKDWGYSIALEEAQAIWDRAYRKTPEPDPREVMLREARRKPKGPITRKDYLKAIRGPVPGAGLPHPSYARLERLAAAYPTQIWQDAPAWEGPFQVRAASHPSGYGTVVIGEYPTLQQAEDVAREVTIGPSRRAFAEVSDRHGIEIASFVDGRRYPSNPLPSEAVDPREARAILRKGTVHGRPLTPGQRGMFGAASRNPRRRTPRQVPIEDTEIDLWFERDRAYVGLDHKDGHTIIDWWDEAVQEAVDDGFLDPRDWHQSAYDYAVDLGLIRP